MKKLAGDRRHVVTSRGVTVLARVAWSLSFALVISSIFMTALDPLRQKNGLPPGGLIAIDAALMAYATAGALILSRYRRNAVGYVFSGLALAVTGGGAGGAYGAYAVHQAHGMATAAKLGLWLADSTTNSPLIFIALIFLLFLFPDGKPASRRWRPLVRATVVIAALLMLVWMFSPGPMQNADIPLRNPLGIDALGGIGKLLQPLFVLLLPLAMLAATSLVLRFRRSTGVERAQLKWFAFAGGLIAATIVLGPVYAWRPSAPQLLWPLAFICALTSVPIAAGTAILRYRLYDIDRIISRTVSYALVTGVLAGTFALVVLLPTALIGSGSKTPEWLVAVGTLAVAALFRPVRRRVQSIVDRRFNRARYDTAHTIATFSSRLRDQIDLDTLGAELTDVVRRTMQPNTVSLWVRPAND